MTRAEEEEEKKGEEEIATVPTERFQRLINEAYDRLKERYGSEPMFTELFTVDEQMEMWDKLNAEEGRADRMLSDTMKHGNQ